MTAHLKEESKE